MDTETGKRIRDQIRAIPCGSVAAYGEIARRAGLPGRARMVARVLSGNEDSGLPWHRVVRSDGSVAFPRGSAEFIEQCRRLLAEGVRVERGRVRGVRVAQTLDARLWGPG